MKVYILDTGCAGKEAVSYINPYESAVVMGDDNGHGTWCNYLIETIHKNAEIKNYKVLNNERKGTTSALLSALKKIYLEETPGIINLSLTTPAIHYKTELRWICENLAKEGFIIFASYANIGNNGYLSKIETVVSVNAQYRSKGEKIMLLDSHNLTLSSNKEPLLVYDMDQRPWFFGGNSKATALASGICSLTRSDSYAKCNRQTFTRDFVVVYNQYFARMRSARRATPETLKKVEGILVDTFKYSYGNTKNNMQRFFENYEKILQELQEQFACSFYKRFVQLGDFETVLSVSNLMEDIVNNETDTVTELAL